MKRIWYTDGEMADDMNKVCELLADSFDEEYYKEELDENGSVDVAGYEFSPSQILKTLSPTSYYKGMENFYENAIDRNRYCIDNMDDGEVLYVLGIKVECKYVEK